MGPGRKAELEVMPGFTQEPLNLPFIWGFSVCGPYNCIKPILTKLAVYWSTLRLLDFLSSSTILYTRICQGSCCLDQLAALCQQTPPTPARHQNPVTWKVAIVFTSLIGSWFLGSIDNYSYKATVCPENFFKS